MSTYYCHICGEPLVKGGTGYSAYELGCVVCQAGYHIDGEDAIYVLPGFAEHGERPVAIPVAHLLNPGHLRHVAPLPARERL